MAKEIRVRSVLNKFKERDSWFLVDYSVNAYYGCPFCIYCYLRGSKYGERMEKGPSVKINAPEVLEKQLAARARKGEHGFIAFSSQEPYLPMEDKYRITRRMLDVVRYYKFPVSILTKSTMVARDFDILHDINKNAIIPKDLSVDFGVVISASLSTLDEKLAKIFEPGAPSPRERLATLKKAHDEGFVTGIWNVPVLPYLSDSEDQIEEMIKTVKENGSDYIIVGGLTLFGDGSQDCKTLYYRALEKHFPELVEKTKNLFGNKFYPPSSYQKRLDEIAREYCRKYGLRYRMG